MKIFYNIYTSHDIKIYSQCSIKQCYQICTYDLQRSGLCLYEMSTFQSALCKELHLPPSELTHCAKLVTLVHYNDHQVSCLAASPEGAVRYWPSVWHEGVFVEISTELRGEECVKLITLQSYQVRKIGILSQITALI